VTDVERYRTALLDWLACAAGGAGEPAARGAQSAGEGLLGRVTAAGIAGHILDFDDTYAPGVIHASACAAPAALVVGAARGADVAAVMDAYAEGFEAAAALARASHPALYDRGWHPTPVCGSVGAAVAAARLLGAREEDASALALLRASGLRAAFGSPGKSQQVGLAAAAGVQAAQLAAAGPTVALAEAAAGFARATGGSWADPVRGMAIRENWIKPWPCCLGAHSTIEAVTRLPAGDGQTLVVNVHPLERKAAALDDASTGLQAKFSIPYLAAFTRLHGPPSVASFDSVDEDARALASDAVTLAVDESLGEWESRVSLGDDGESARVEFALGSPARPLDASSLSTKVRSLAGDRLDGALDDPERPVAEVLAAISP
jgi:2-methylcitrate dehydratase PrpD